METPREPLPWLHLSLLVQFDAYPLSVSVLPQLLSFPKLFHQLQATNESRPSLHHSRIFLGLKFYEHAFSFTI